MRVGHFLILTCVAACARREPGSAKPDSASAAVAPAASPAAAPEASPTPDSAGPLQIMNAASVTRPLRAVLDSFSARTGVSYAQEPGASLEVARRITELGRRPDIVVLADPEVFPQLLMPRFTTWYALFGRNRIVLAYTDQSRGATEITSDTWREVVQRRGVETGRADPNTDPSGYRTLLTFQLAEQFYKEPGLARRLLDAAPARNVRPREADQVGLLQTHQLDYIWTYQNLADNDGLKFVKLPDAIDLGNPADSALYATASTRVVGTHVGDTLTVRGAPILFAVSAATRGPHPAAAARFLAYLLSIDGRRILRAQHFDALDHAVVVGSGAPAALTSPPPR
ncbi:MAG TPA: extracellular solute-binding protein [Gemmatimonadaceae bacterium]|nr:extracellular solute-binding protein [Gemmatimonadaceae bacterium]